MHLITLQEKRLQNEKIIYESPCCWKYRYVRFVLVLAGIIGTSSFHIHNVTPMLIADPEPAFCECWTGAMI